MNDCKFSKDKICTNNLCWWFGFVCPCLSLFDIFCTKWEKKDGN